MGKRALALVLLTATTGAAPPRAPQVVELTTARLAEVRAGFNAAERFPRLLVFLSAGCAACVPAAASLEELARTHPGPMSIVVVWDSVDGSQQRPEARAVASLTDPRIRQLWDPGHLLSSEMRKVVDAKGAVISQARLRTGNEDQGVLYDTVVLFPPGARWEKQLPTPAYWDGGFAAVRDELERRLEAFLPRRK